MADINIGFCRALLREAHDTVKKLFPKTNLTADAWVIRTDRQSWEFHGPASFYWFGRADNAYHARYQGWMAWLRKQGYEV